MPRLLDVRPVLISLSVPLVLMDTTFMLSIAVLRIVSFARTRFLVVFIVVAKANVLSVFRGMC